MSDSTGNLPDFSGKCISITIKDDSTNHDLWNPRFEYQGPRLFIIGTVPVGATESDWVAGCYSAVAWDCVTDYYVFDSIDAYSAATEVSREFHENDAEDSDDSGI